MKSLDEVIRSLEICSQIDIDRTCKDCSYDSASSMCMNDLVTDALHYIKECKENRAIIAEAREKAKKAIDAELQSLREKLANQMEGISEKCCNTCDCYDIGCYCNLWSRSFPSDHWCKTWEPRNERETDEPC